MSTGLRGSILHERTFEVGSVGVFLGLALIALGGPLLTTADALTVILGAVSLLLSVGLYLDDPEPVAEEDPSSG